MTDADAPLPAFGLSGSQRGKDRESIFLGASLLFDGAKVAITTRIRNISAGGMMVDTTAPRAKGQRVVATIKGIGEVDGVVAWTTENRVGIAFDQPIDPKKTRQTVHGNGPVTNFIKPNITERRPGLSIR